MTSGYYNRWYWKRLQYLIKWKGFGLENNSWKDTFNVSASDQVTEFYLKHPDIPRYICHMDLKVVFKFSTIASNYNNLGKDRCRRIGSSKTCLFCVFLADSCSMIFFYICIYLLSHALEIPAKHSSSLLFWFFYSKLFLIT